MGLRREKELKSLQKEGMFAGRKKKEAGVFSVGVFVGRWSRDLRGKCEEEKEFFWTEKEKEHL